MSTRLEGDTFEKAAGSFTAPGFDNDSNRAAERFAKAYFELPLQDRNLFNSCLPRMHDSMAGSNAAESAAN
ncbi:MAG: hypothetical protein LBU32_31620 [Clostridiales bacterium]|jgi:hypothetical protein|nr:hypothetical protein [Clostridiales bacterium]